MTPAGGDVDGGGANDGDLASAGEDGGGANDGDPARSGVDGSGANHGDPARHVSDGVDDRGTDDGDGGVDGGDAGSDGSGGSDVWEGYEHADDGVAMTDLDARVEAALAATPVDLPTHRPSQCESRY